VPSVHTRRVKVEGHRPQLLTGADPTGAFDDTVKLIKDAGYSFALVAPGTGYLSGQYRNANGITVRDPGAGVWAVEVREDVSDAQRSRPPGTSWRTFGADTLTAVCTACTADGAKPKPKASRRP
jgi:hypothetical protein